MMMCVIALHLKDSQPQTHVKPVWMGNPALLRLFASSNATGSPAQQHNQLLRAGKSWKKSTLLQIKAIVSKRR